MSLPKELNFLNKPMAASSKASLNRFRSDNSSYSQNDYIQIEIPCGRNGQYLFPKSSFVEGSLSLNITNPVTTTTDISGNPTYSTAAGSIYLDQSVFSLFNRMIVKHGSNVIEDLQFCNKVWTSIMDVQYSSSERQALTITHLIADKSDYDNTKYNNGLNGIKVHSFSATTPTTATSQTVTTSSFDFSIPLPSALLGTLSSKAIPLGECGSSSIYLLLELASVNMPFVSETITNFNPVINSFTVSNIYYNAKISTIPNDIHSALIQSMNGVINLPAVSYQCETKTISAGTKLFNDKFSFQFSSLKNLSFFLQNSSVAGGLLNKRSISSRPKCFLSEWYITVNGEAFPSQAISTTSRMYSELMRAWDMLCDVNSGGVICYNNYAAADVNSHTLDSGDFDVLLTGDYGAATQQQRFLCGLDLDSYNHSSDVLMSGLSTTGEQLNINLNFTNPITDSLTLYAYTQFDILYNIIDGQISYKK